MQPNGLEPLEDVEVWEPDADPTTRTTTGPTLAGRRTTLSVPGAIAGAFLVCALAFGSSLGSGGFGRTSADGDLEGTAPTATDPAAVGNVAVLGEGGDGDATKDDAANPGAETEPEPDSEGPEKTETPAETETPIDPAHETQAIRLELGLRGNDVKLAWTACKVDGFVAYKIIRSTNMGATYPRGEGDSLIGVVESASRTTFVDERAPAETKLWYAVFGLARDGDDTYVACASDDKGLITPPKPEPTEKPVETAAPDVPALALSLAIKEGHVYLDWSTCKAEGADVYKVVRSKDSTVRWPLGDYDTLVAAVGMDGTTAAWDESAPKGKRLWYRVFCLRDTGDGYKVLTSSATKSIETPAGEPAPEVVSIGLEVDSVEGQAVLHWEACTMDGFSHYRIVRKAYEGTTVVKEIEDAGVTTWTDTSVVVGETYKYTVQCKGHVGDTWPLLGTSGAVAVTIE